MITTRDRVATRWSLADGTGLLLLLLLNQSPPLNRPLLHNRSLLTLNRRQLMVMARSLFNTLETDQDGRSSMDERRHSSRIHQFQARHNQTPCPFPEAQDHRSSYLLRTPR